MTEQIVTTNQPWCGECRAQIRPNIRAAYYVRVAGTTGLYRHVCLRCLQPNDQIVARFVAPEEA